MCPKINTHTFLSMFFGNYEYILPRRKRWCWYWSARKLSDPKARSENPHISNNIQQRIPEKNGAPKRDVGYTPESQHSKQKKIWGRIPSATPETSVQSGPCCIWATTNKPNLLMFVVSWVVPPPSIPVTTRIITFLVGDPNLNLHLPQFLGGGPQPKLFPCF